MAISDTNNVQSRSDDVLLEVRNASVTFDMDRGESRVLNDVTLDIHDQEILGVVGESGSGKSMFASSLLDAVVDPGRLTGEITYYPDDGDPIDIMDLDTESLKALRWEEISMVFQGAMSSWNPTLDIRGHFKETLETHDADVSEGMDHARELLSNLYLDPNRVLDSYPHELSGGMKQRTLIALALVLRPKVVVMDEPTAALDLLMQRSILSLLEDLKETYDLTVVFITHDLPLVAGLADRLAVMYAFEFAEIAPADQVLDSPSHPYTRALLNAVPNLDTPLSEMEVIEGSSPDPVNVPVGCSYAPRCPLADEMCRNTDPELYDIADNHRAACHYTDRAKEEIPLAITEAEDRDLVTREGKQSEDPVVSLSDVSVQFEESGGGLLGIFNDPDIVRAVDSVDLDIYENDVVALVGESGCGKTTLGKAAIGVERPTEGSIQYREQDIWDAKDFQGEIDIPYRSIRRALQIIHQDPGSSLNPNTRVLQTLERPLLRWQSELGREDRRERIHGLLEVVGMTPADDYAGRYPHQLSGGEKQRVALIRALLMNPDLILADEAVSALDVSLRVEMMDLMLELQDAVDTSYLFISHNLSNARYFAGQAGGRIGVMYLGEIVEIGPAEDVVKNPKHPYTKVLKWSTASLETGQEIEEPPIRGIDIPDPVDPPSGCRFHTRCPEAREACREHTPELDLEGEEGHRAACFREVDGHPYWESDPIEGDEEEPSQTVEST
jgi:peptide/nickel transport system ATP-binding protein